MEITGFSCWVVEHDPMPAFAWRQGLPSTASDSPDPLRPRKAVLRMETDTGTFGATELGKGDGVADAVRRRFDRFLGADPLMTERVWHLMWETDRIEEFPVHTTAAIDLLCWDVKSKVAGMPVHQMVGGNDTVVPAYASTVTWPDLAAYERHIRLCLDMGFTAFKLHAWGDVDADIVLCRSLRRWVGPDADLMYDGSAGFDYVDALKIGRALEAEGFLWYEEPMREHHIGHYARLREKLDIPILAAETTDGAHWNMASWVEAAALDMVRVSAAFKGGITGALKIAHLGESFGMRAQVHGMGEANAQLCAAIPNNDYYEQLVINEDQIRGLGSLGDLSVVDGQLTVRTKPGLSPDYDWDEIDRAALARIDVTADGIREERRR
ncbi:enolase C-terminal domain-like protein [Bauldia sp.]|uniref:enolase C-terminal domain-like protein n=1 Tax=Bauldia sp. TaxID=2575872 RepID=UPI003BABB1D6